jgi:hypothetical protein
MASPSEQFQPAALADGGFGAAFYLSLTSPLPAGADLD